MLPQCMKVYEAILMHYERHGVAPTVRELAKTMGFRSANAVTIHLAELRDRGLLPSSDGRSRSLVPVEMTREIRLIAGRILVGLSPAMPTIKPMVHRVIRKPELIGGGN